MAIATTNPATGEAVRTFEPLNADQIQGTLSWQRMPSKSTAKYTDIVSLMTRDSGLKPDEALLWSQMGYGQIREAVGQRGRVLQESHRSRERFQKAACLRPWSGAGRFSRDLRAHRQGSRGQCRL